MNEPMIELRRNGSNTLRRFAVGHFETEGVPASRVSWLDRVPLLGRGRAGKAVRSAG